MVTNYMIKEIPVDLWKKVKMKALENDKTVRAVLMEFLQTYTAEKGGKK